MRIHIALFVALGSGFLTLSACKRRPPEAQWEVLVECKAAGTIVAQGFLCSLDHRQGPGPGHVCWTMKIGCLNGVAGEARGCGDVNPMSKSSSLLHYAAFNHSLDKCDTTSVASVENVTVTPKTSP